MHDSSASLEPFGCILGDRLLDRWHVQKTEDQVVVEEEGEEEGWEGNRLYDFGSGWRGITRSECLSLCGCVSDGEEAPARVAMV